jgi:UDP-N-acetylmuramoylalanine--D-glutamate ligase
MAIKSFPKGSVLLVAGGYERNQDFQELVEVMAEYQVKALFALPSTGERLLQKAQAKFSLVAKIANNVQEAVALAKAQAQKGDVVLLSPASASYNSFANYEERGAAFAKAVKES